MFILLIPFSLEDHFMFQKDPRWNYMAKLQTDEERYQLCRKLWKSLVVPDPNVNLTYFGHLKHQRNDTIPGNGKPDFRCQCLRIIPFAFYHLQYDCCFFLFFLGHVEIIIFVTSVFAICKDLFSQSYHFSL